MNTGVFEKTTVLEYGKVFVTRKGIQRKSVKVNIKRYSFHEPTEAFYRELEGL